MIELDILKGEFDESRRVLHLTAERPAHIRNTVQLEKVCDDVCRLLEQHTVTGRCYMLVDTSMIEIIPEMAEEHIVKMNNICEKYLLPDGLLRYGSQITGITAKVTHEMQNLDDQLLFRSKAEALEYIDNLQKRSLEQIQG
jgi:hypothetical protein